MDFYHYSVGFKTFSTTFTSYFYTILHEFVVVIVVVANMDTLKSPKNQHLFIDRFHRRDFYWVHFITLQISTFPYEITLKKSLKSHKPTQPFIRSVLSGVCYGVSGVKPAFDDVFVCVF